VTGRNGSIEDSDGNAIADPEEVRERWKIYI